VRRNIARLCLPRQLVTGKSQNYVIGQLTENPSRGVADSRSVKSRTRRTGQLAEMFDEEILSTKTV